ncbi:hypothetical protein A5778_09470 [Mycolicibacterium monacense]|nr:hypothetical protein [Mycolicibacterium monacense]OBF54941.1 hypothetical protein A5778_09470 [Mycolicibacterium monacense]
MRSDTEVKILTFPKGWVEHDFLGELRIYHYSRSLDHLIADEKIFTHILVGFYPSVRLYPETSRDATIDISA